MKKFICFVILFSNISLNASESKGKITVHMINFRNNKGDVYVSLYNSGDGFPEEAKKAYKSIKAKIINNKAEVVFSDILFGNYAVSILHDENSNGDMDSNWLGIPKEGYGASNNPQNKFGPPKFDEAKFKLDSEQLNISIKLQY
ncbi:MAG: DUF2141 domain-containing protein [Candidatus Firestonebacteria bacterium]|nr:DUF2141 domain-containing protein [Candidatus Firestonebacteria bacterium]